MLWDFQQIGIDLVDFFDGTKGYSLFWEYFDGLPTESKTKAKISDDPEYAKAYVGSLDEEYILSLAEQKADDVELPEEGYSRINQQMDDLADEISLLRHTVLSLLGGKKNKSEFKPRKRPTSAIQRELKNRIWEAERADNQDLFGKFGF